MRDDTIASVPGLRTSAVAIALALSLRPTSGSRPPASGATDASRRGPAEYDDGREAFAVNADLQECRVDPVGLHSQT